MNYQEFCQEAQRRLTPEEMASNEIVDDATAKEVQWRKGWEVRRALRHKGAGKPTRQDLHLLEEKTEIVISYLDYRNVIAKEIASDFENADKYFPLIG